MSWQSKRARLAVLHRDHQPDSPVIADARRELRAARTADYLKRQIEADPPFTDDDLALIRAVLPPASDAGAAA